MRLPPKSARRAGPLAVLAGLVVTGLLAASCTPGEQPAATVNGEDISAADLRADLEAERAAADDQGADGAELLQGEGEGTFKATAATSALTFRILNQLLADQLEELDVEVTPEDQAAGEQLLCSDQPGCLEGFPQRYQDFLGQLGARFAAFSRSAGPPPPDPPPARSEAELEAAARQQYDQALAQNPEALQQVCVVATQVPDEATAQLLRTAVESGQDFATAAAGLGAPTGPEQCGSSAEIPPELATAQAGEVVGPIAAQGAVFVAQVTRRGQVSFEEVRDRLVQQLQQQAQQAQQAQQPDQQAVQDALAAAATDADITVDPRYGRWDLDQLRVVPPELPEGYAPETSQPAVPAAPGG